MIKEIIVLQKIIDILKNYNIKEEDSIFLLENLCERIKEINKKNINKNNIKSNEKEIEIFLN